MHILTEEQIEEIYDKVDLLPLSEVENILDYKNKGYGSFLLEIARLLAFEINKNGLACRFLTVDADIEYNENTPMFYNKNGFIKNNSGVYSNRTQCISMRADILNRHQVQVEEKEYIL